MIQRLRKMSEIYILVGMAIYIYLELNVVLRKDPEISKEFLAIFH